VPPPVGQPPAISARIDAGAGNRADELAELSRDFDHIAEQMGSLISSQCRRPADISLELRSPLARLTVALGLARLSTNSESTSALDRIEVEAERLNTLIGSLLRLTRIEGGSKVMESELVMLDRVVRDVAADAGFEAQGRGRRVRIAQADSCTVLGNRQLLRSAIENAIRNAVRYADEGTEVQLALKKLRSNGNGTVVVSVRDLRRGVAREVAP